MSKNSESVIKWRKRTKQLIVESMGGSCQTCGYFQCVEALDLHHINPVEKEISFGRIRANPISINKIAEELEKCILLCCRCHREVHAGLLEIPVEYFRFNSDFLFKSKIEMKKRKEAHKEKISKSLLLRKKITLTNEELHDKLISNHGGNVSSLAREMNVSETTIRKRIKRVKLNVAVQEE